MLYDDVTNDKDYVGLKRATEERQRIKSKLRNLLGTEKASKLVFLYKFMN